MTTPMPTTIRADDFVIIIKGQDDVADGQICRVLDRSEEPNYEPSDFLPGTDLGVYHPAELVAVLCWTGYLVHTEFRNLVPVATTADGRAALSALFADGSRRNDDMIVTF